MIEKSGPNAVDRVARYIIESISNYQYTPNLSLNELKLCEATGANRAAVRAAYSRLAAKGLIVIKTHSGAAVRSYSSSETCDAFYARRQLETGIIGSLDPRIVTNNISHLCRLATEGHRESEAGNILRANKLSREFHSALNRLSSNQLLTDLAQDLIDCQPLFLCAQAIGEGVIATTNRIWKCWFI